MSMLFDATYYMDARPDVLNAYVNLGAQTGTGMSWAAFAEQHYNTFGWKEGYNPNATFNTQEYLEANTDVLEAGVNPFQHYLTFGVSEGRAPNAGTPSRDDFDWETYVAANADLQEAGIDTAEEAYTHFIIFGQFEVRDGKPEIQKPGDSFTLTTGVDAPGASAPAADTTGTDADDTYNAFLVNAEAAAAGTGSTLQISDLIDGRDGTDTLKVTVTGANSTAALNQALPITSNLENVHVRNLSTGTASGVTLDAALADGLTEVGNTGSTAAVAFTSVGNNATVRVADSSAATSVTYADKVFQAGGTASLSLNNAGTSSTDALITLGAAATTGTATTLAIAAEGKNFINLSAGTQAIAAANGIKTVTVSGSGSLNIDATAAVVGAAGSLAADITKLDASTNTGGVTATVSNTKVAVTGGSGDDVITVGGALVEGASIKLGADNDSLLQTGAGAIGAKVTVDGGEGIDSISTALINAGNGSQFLNFERLDLAAGTLDASLLTGSTITDLVLSGAGGTTINNVKAGVDLIVTSTTAAATTTINVVDATKAGNTSDVFDINFDGAAVSGAAATSANVKAGTIALAGIETVNIASNGGANTWNSITLTNDAAKVINITGTKNLDLTVTDQALVAPATDHALATVDASAATGNIKVVMGAAFDGTVKTGSGNDVIVVANETTITTGAGKDVIDVTGATGADEIVTITDFAVKTDKIQFTDKGTETFSATKVDISSATTLTAALNLAAAGDGNTDAAITWFQFGGDTYVVQDTDAGATLAATDHVVKLTGLVDLSSLTVSDFNFA